MNLLWTFLHCNSIIFETIRFRIMFLVRLVYIGPTQAGLLWRNTCIFVSARQHVQVEAAHLCYLVGGVLPQVYDVGARMCLLGADHRALPHTLASLSALQRTEVLEWTKLPGACSL